MILSIFNTTEFYVAIFVIAAAVVAYAAMPSGKGAAREYLLAGALCVEPSDEEPSVEIECLDSGAVVLTRRGVGNVGGDGAVSIAITQIGFDLIIKERLTPGKLPPEPLTAMFRLDFMGQERYHVRYESEAISRGCTLVFHCRPGIKVRRTLER